MKKVRIIVVGGGLAGLMATIKIAEMEQEVDLFSIVPVRRSHSVCAQGGINAAIDQKGTGDSPWEHFYDTIYGGDFLADQPPALKMCETGPTIIHMFDRMGVPFNRTAEGNLDFRRFGGAKHPRTAFAGATTGQQLLYALDEQVRRREAPGLVKKYEYWELLSLIIDDRQTCRGITAMNLRSMEVRSFPADAVILATGGIGAIFGRSTNSVICTGSAQSIAYQQGAFYANGEFVQVHPTAIPGEDKLRLMSESARGEGGRIWVPRVKGDARPPAEIPERERWYFLEEKYPEYGNLVPRDIATREVFQVILDGYGINGETQVYLDLTHIPRDVLDRKLMGILEIYETFVGDDPREVPMRIFPGVHYTMGGLWVDYGQRTNIPGLFACGECDYSIHGANRLGANALLSCVYGGGVAGPNAVRFAEARDHDGSEALYDSERRRQEEINEDLIRRQGPENIFDIHDEMGRWMTDNATVIRYNDRLRATDDKLLELLERYRRINVNDVNLWATMILPHARQLYNMLQLARVITLGALERNESRGAHYKPEFPARNDAEWLRTTKAAFSGESPVFGYEEVDTSLIKPRVRDYGRAMSAASRQETGEEMKPADVDRYAEDERLKAEQQAANHPRESLDRRAGRL